jgi:hypothetical protein
MRDDRMNIYDELEKFVAALVPGAWEFGWALDISSPMLARTAI